MKTIKAWFSHIRYEPLREKLLRNMQYSEIEVHCFRDAVWKGFSFVGSPEDYDYWIAFCNCLTAGLTAYHAFLACEAQVHVYNPASDLPKIGVMEDPFLKDDRLAIYHKVTKMMDEIKDKINPASDSLESLHEIWESLMILNTKL